jgi:hypothetical protein
LQTCEEGRGDERRKEEDGRRDERKELYVEHAYKYKPAS